MKSVHPVAAGVISFVFVTLVLLFSYFVLGGNVVVPIMEFFIEARRVSGENVGVFEAITAFVLVMGYMLVITAMVVVAALSGWLCRKLVATGSFSLHALMDLFRVGEPE